MLQRHIVQSSQANQKQAYDTKLPLRTIVSRNLIITHPSCSKKKNIKEKKGAKH